MVPNTNIDTNVDCPCLLPPAPLLVRSELCFVGCGEFFGPVSDGFEDTGEEAQGFGLMDKTESAHQVAVVIEHGVWGRFPMGVARDLLDSYFSEKNRGQNQ